VDTKEEYTDEIRLVRELRKHLWPSGISNEREIKTRVVLSLSLLAVSKVITLQVPFIFKRIIDGYNDLPASAAAAVGSADLAPLVASDPATLAAVPVAMTLGYGIARSTANLCQEARSAVFASVAQDAIRRIAKDIFEHLHRLDMQFHLDKSTGVTSRVIDRGSKSINFALSSIIFNVAPTILEVSMVTGLLAVYLGPQYSVVAATTVGAYVLFTVKVSNWRTNIRRDMNKNDNEASGKATDSLLNFENVKLYCNEGHEVSRYDKSLSGYQKAAVLTQTSLSYLNFGQNLIFSAGLSAMMLM
jgi:ABC-type multidrug transport system fused ATPase/permease subunit